MRTNLLIIVLALALAAGVGYIAYDSGRTAGIAEARASISSFNTGRAAAGQAANGQGAPTGARANPLGALFGGLQGTVEKVDSGTFSVTVTRGQQTQSVTVTVASTGSIQQISGASLGDIKPGSHIIVAVDQAQAGAPPAGAQGQQIPANVTARSILLLPPNFGQ